MLWSAACIMYQLVTLDHKPPDHRAPFQPQFDINDDQSQDWTFGWNFQAFPYSKILKDLIYECLYETPEYRPELLDMRNRIAKGIQYALDADAPMEPWSDFVMAEPVDVLPPRGAAALPVIPPVILPVAGPLPVPPFGPPLGGPGYIVSISYPIQQSYTPPDKHSPLHVNVNAFSPRTHANPSLASSPSTAGPPPSSPSTPSTCTGCSSKSWSSTTDRKMYVYWVKR